jgi:soluble lytic murein transglycosylase-like protein
LLAFLLNIAVAVFADIGAASVSMDFDAEFACAADMVEAGQRAQAERIFGEIVRLSGQPAWDARAAFVLAADDERRGEFVSAARRLAEISAEGIGLEAYRHLALARSYAAAGRRAEAQTEARLAFAAQEPFAMRARVGLRLARLLEAAGRRREAAQTLAAAAAGAQNPDAEVIAGERIWLAEALGDQATARSVARALLLSGTVESRLPESVRPTFRREEAALSQADRGRRARALLATGDAARAVKFLSGVAPSVWPAAERAANLLALAEAQHKLHRARAADKTLARVPDDGTEAAFAAKLLRADLDLARLRGGKGKPAAAPEDQRFAPVLESLTALTQLDVPASVRTGTRERLVRLLSEQGRFDEALAEAREFACETSGTGATFEPLWKLAWQRWNEGDAAGARQRIEAIETLSPEFGRSRRLAYWKARCLAREGRAHEADALFARLAAGDPADLYAQFARRHAAAAPARPAPAADPATATAIYRLPDELLRARMFEEAGAEARSLPAARGRDLRVAQAEFALGRFFPAITAVKRAFPQMGTAEEAGVPDAWRRLYYPIEEGGFLLASARQAGLDAAVLRALVRQESVFDARARSKAGAIGLMQLVPATAKSLSRSVLRAQYRRAFLYDPGKNMSLGAAYLKDLVGQFNGSLVFALAAYNGGPTVVSRVIAENPGRDEDEVFESHPFFETRDYVRRVLLYAESYRALYP